MLYPYLDLSDLPNPKARSSNWVPAQLGKVSAFEFLPANKAEEALGNFWVICKPRAKSTCVRLLPVSKTNSKVLDVVGGLTESRGSSGSSR